MKKAVIILLLLLITSVVVNFWQYSKTDGEVDGDAVLKRDVTTDTIPSVAPEPKDSVVIRYVTKVLPVAPAVPTDQTGRDTIVGVALESVSKTDTPDGLAVSIPITQKVYEDSTYRAYVSGFDVSLDSINVYRRTEKIYIRSPTKQKRFNVGIQAGYGYTPKGFQPYIGVGISATLFSF